jgi:dUTP pyrophosphatase
MKYVLFLFIDPADKMMDWYKTSIQTRNPADSGFDLFTPDLNITFPKSCFKIDYRVKCAMYELGGVQIEYALERREQLKPQAFYLYARSSIAKTNFRLSNSVGIIDSQYRGNIGAYFDAIELNRDNNYCIEEKTRLVQLCHPTLEPFHIIMVNSAEQLGSTRRGTGGFGSSGV